MSANPAPLNPRTPVNQYRSATKQAPAGSTIGQQVSAYGATNKPQPRAPLTVATSITGPVRQSIPGPDPLPAVNSSGKPYARPKLGR